MTKPLQCLLIEDDVDDQEIFVLCLKRIKQNVDCTIANNGVEALQKLKGEQSFTPDIIFLDVNMPKMNGLDCLREIRNIARLDRTKVYVYSTTSEESVVQQSKDLGADEYITKPAKTLDLKEKLAQIFTICEQAALKTEI